MAYTPVPPSPLRRIARAFGHILIASAFAVVLIAAARAGILWVTHARAALEFPYPLNYGEGPLLDQAVRLSQGEALYRADLTQPPYTITNYPPLYMLIQAPFVSTFGASFAYGRALSLIGTIIAALSVAGIVRATTRDWIAGLAAGLALIAMPYIFFWSALARIDSLALGLSLFGVWVVIAAPRRATALIFGAGLIAAAAYTRQTYLLAAPMGAFAYLWGGRMRNEALGFAVALGCWGMGALVLLTLATGGGWFFHIVTANVNPLNDRILTTYADEMGRALPIFLGGGALFLGGGWIVRGDKMRGRASAWWLIAPYSLGAVVVALTIVKVGSDMNYLYELMAALCLAAGALTAWAGRLPYVGAVVKTACLLLIAVQMGLAADLSESRYAPFNTRRIDARPQIDELYAFIQAEDAPILTDEWMGLLVLAGKPILMQPFEMSQLAATGVWNETPFLMALARGDYPVVLLYQPFDYPILRRERWTAAMLRLFNDAYRPESQRAATTIYRFAE